MLNKRIHINFSLKSVFFFRKLTLVIFISFLFYPLSAQVFIKNNTTFSVKQSAFIHSSDSIVTKPAVATDKPKIYIIRSTSIHQLENTNADIIYISAEKSQQKTKVAKITRKHDKKKSQKKPETDFCREQYARVTLSGKPADKNLSGNRFADVVITIISNKPFSKFFIIIDLIKNSFENLYLNSSYSLRNLKEKVDVSHNNYSVTRPPPVLV